MSFDFDPFFCSGDFDPARLLINRLASTPRDTSGALRLSPFVRFRDESPALPLALVVALLFPRSPSAVARFVTAVVIKSVNCHAGGAFAHIREEVLEAIGVIFMPAGAYFDAARAVVSEVTLTCAVAPSVHSPPRAESWRRRMPAMS